MGFTTTGAATRPTDEVLQRFDGVLDADMAAGDLADFAAVPDHVLCPAAGPALRPEPRYRPFAAAVGP